MHHSQDTRDQAHLPEIPLLQLAAVQCCGISSQPAFGTAVRSICVRFTYDCLARTHATAEFGPSCVKVEVAVLMSLLVSVDIKQR